MTDNQIRAKDYLDQYRGVKHELNYLKQRVEYLQAQAESIRSTSDIPVGWTGRYVVPSDKIVIPKSRIKRSQAKKNSRQQPDHYEKEMVVLEGKTTPDPKRHESTLIKLAEQSRKYDRELLIAQGLIEDIESRIKYYCGPIAAAILRYRYLSLMTFDEIAKALHYSKRQVIRRHYQALEEFGAKLP